MLDLSGDNIQVRVLNDILKSKAGSILFDIKLQNRLCLVDILCPTKVKVRDQVRYREDHDHPYPVLPDDDPELVQVNAFDGIWCGR